MNHLRSCTECRALAWSALATLTAATVIVTVALTYHP